MYLYCHIVLHKMIHKVCLKSQESNKVKHYKKLHQFEILVHDLLQSKDNLHCEIMEYRKKNPPNLFFKEHYCRIEEFQKLQKLTRTCIKHF